MTPSRRRKIDHQVSRALIGGAKDDDDEGCGGGAISGAVAVLAEDAADGADDRMGDRLIGSAMAVVVMGASSTMRGGSSR
jgi:hypothetical protein